MTCVVFVVFGPDACIVVAESGASLQRCGLSFYPLKETEWPKEFLPLPSNLEASMFEIALAFPPKSTLSRVKKALAKHGGGHLRVFSRFCDAPSTDTVWCYGGFVSSKAAKSGAK